MTTYNGYKNRETWLVNLHLGEYLSETIGESYDGLETTLYAVAQHIEDTIGELFNDEIDSMNIFLRDFINLGLIDYRELANLYTSEIDSITITDL